MPNNTPVPHISICIPAYQRAQYLKRLLDSIAEQDYPLFEVVVSDDSADDIVENLTRSYAAAFTIRYYRNDKALGTPANWNAAIKRAEGEWIKLMHDDDWFARPDALRRYAEATLSGKPFIVAGYDNQFELPGQQVEKKPLSATWKKRISETPMTLLAYNVIGPPSVTLLHRSIAETYDERLKWRVDMEFYVRLLNQYRDFIFIPDILVHVGISGSQVTQSCLYVPSVELPEGRLLLEKHGLQPLSNIWVYDAWWRLLRNMDIVLPEQLTAWGTWPDIIYAMQKDLAETPANMRRFGLFSKAFMYLSFRKNQSLIPKSGA